MKILVTGAAGFIGAAISEALLERGDEVVGLDNLNNYYSIRLKKARLQKLQDFKQFRFHLIDIVDDISLAQLFRKEKPQRVLHLAAQVGVRYSLENPQAYVSTNIQGFNNVIENSRLLAVDHFVYASSSSVYGANTSMPYAEIDSVNHPLSLYAASKKANELIAHTYSHLYALPTTGLRFFSVYGPWGRPDMAFFHFTENIIADKPINLFNGGKHNRDFTYIEDVVAALLLVIDKAATPNPTWSSGAPAPNSSNVPYRIYNVGNHQPVSILTLVDYLERCIGKKAIKNLLPIQLTEVAGTWAAVDDLLSDFGIQPSVTLEQGVESFIHWYQNFYGENV